MKTKLIILNLILIVTVLSCKDAVVSFEVPQPESITQQKEFPTKLIGKYYNSENNTQLIIGKYCIIKKGLIIDTIRFSALEKDEIIKNDTLYNPKTGEKYKIKKINDTIFTNYIYTDTTFNLKETDVLKKYKGYYFLNKAVEKNASWEVEKLTLSKGVLSINGIKTEGEISLLEKITETKKDTAKAFLLKPSKKQFKQFIKENGFSEGENYLRE